MAGSGGSAPFEPRPGVFVVGSGKGGVGTSVVAALLAVEAARRHGRVLLVDADETVGSLHLMFGQDDGGPGLGALRKPGVVAEDLLRQVAPGVSLLSGGGGGVDATLSSALGERRSLLRRVSGLYDDFTTVVVDGGSRLESVMAACSAGAARLLCVTTGDRISLAASYALFKVARARFRGLPVDLLVNRADAAEASDLHAVVGRAARSFLATDIGFGGSIPTSPEVVWSLQAGVSLFGVEARSGAGTAMTALGDRLFGSRASGAADDQIVHLIR